MMMAFYILAAPRQYYANSKYYGDSSRAFSFGITKCYGWEKSISECTAQSHLSCSRSQAAGVICRDGEHAGLSL